MTELSKMTEIIREVFENEVITATPDLEIRKLENWDSFNHINLMIAAEDALDIVIMPNEMETIYTVRDLLDIAERKRQ